MLEQNVIVRAKCSDYFEDLLDQLQMSLYGYIFFILIYLPDNSDIQDRTWLDGMQVYGCLINVMHEFGMIELSVRNQIREIM